MPVVDPMPLAAPQARVPVRRRSPAPAVSAGKPTPQKAEAKELVRISGEVVRVIHKDPRNGFLILKIKTGQGKFASLKGNPNALIDVGKRVRAMASVHVHPQYGPQYAAELIEEEIPSDKAGVIAYLAREVDGVGKGMAARIYDKFRGDTYRVIGETPERLLEVPGITPKRLEQIKASWSENSVIRDIWDVLGKWGLGGSLPMRLYNEFGLRSLEVLQKRPYELTKIGGIGFKTADAMAQAVGVAADSPARIAGAIQFLVEETGGQGNTSIPRNVLVEQVLKLIEIEDAHDKVEASIDTLTARGFLVQRFLSSAQCITPRRMALAERNIAERIQAIARTESTNERLAAQAFAKAQSLGDADQTLAVTEAFRHSISVITGRPGCGKTTVTKVIAEVADRAGLRIRLCAPTGKAARRMTEATGFPSSTVHSMLGYGQAGSVAAEEDKAGADQATAGAWKYDRDNPLAGDVFIVDETSMLDTFTARGFFNAVPDGARVILVGDSDQLPSVGAGNILHDIIASGRIPTTHLRTIHRTALDSDIVLNAHRVIDGDLKGIDLHGTKDFRFTSAIEDDALVAAVLEQYKELVDKYGLEGVQVLAARRGTPVGVNALNDALRAQANPPREGQPTVGRGSLQFREGDRVMRTKNSKTLGVVNGEVGIITRIDEDNKTAFVDFGDRIVPHKGPELSELELAYAITAHKSQGSEYGGVVFIMPRAHLFMLNRNLMYTAMTRGKKEVRIIGNGSAVRGAISKEGSRRCTGLEAEIVETFGVDSVVDSMLDLEASFEGVPVAGSPCDPIRDPKPSSDLAPAPVSPLRRRPVTNLVQPAAEHQAVKAPVFRRPKP